MFHLQQKGLMLWAGLVCFGGTVKASELDSYPVTEQEYKVTHWTAENRLPQNTVKAVAQTTDGYLWIGTLIGLARFDGIKFTVFDHNTTPELTHDSINDLTADSQDGSLWIATGGGLVHYQNHLFQRLGPDQGVPGAVGPLCAAIGGGVWCSPREGQIALVRDGKVKTWDFGPSNSAGYVRQLIERESGEILAIVGFRAVHIELSSGKCTRLKLPPGSDFCFSWAQARNGRALLYRADGIWLRQDSNWKLIKPAVATEILAAIGDLSAIGLSSAQAGQFWFAQALAGRSDLFKVVDDHLLRINAPELPPDLNFLRLFEDREGNLWIGTTTGLFLLQPKRLKVYSRKDGLRDDDTLGVACSPDGTVWVGTPKGISTIRDGKVYNPPPPDGNGWGRVLTFAADSQNQLWLERSPAGLNCLQDNQWKVVYDLDGFKTNHDLVSFYEDHQGRLWTSKLGAVFCYERGHWTRFSIPQDISRGDVRVIYQDRRGDMWFGTFGEGLLRLHAGHFSVHRTVHDEYNNRAWCILEDSDGVFWIGSEDGLNRFVAPIPAESASTRDHPTGLSPPPGNGSFFTFTTSQGLYHNVINNIQEDDFGNLWLSGLHGIYRVSRQELNEVATGKRSQLRCLVLGEPDGMLCSECNGGDNQPAGCKDPRGRVWFPTAKGVVVVDPRQIHSNHTPPPVAIEQIKANGQVVWGDDFQGPSERLARAGHSSKANVPVTLRIGPGFARVLEIHYTANSFTAPDRARFRFRLDGCDPDWETDDANRRMASYINLKPGDYRFHVIACNNNGVWGDEGAEMLLSIAPHLYETKSFYAVCSLLALAVVLGVHHWRVKSVNRLKQLEQELALDKERARIARDIHDDLGSRFLQISVLGELSNRNIGVPGNARPHLDKLRSTTAEAFQALDEIVWAANPKQDSMDGLISYLREYVPQFLDPLGIKCRLDFPHQVPVRGLRAEIRHHLFLVIKEALQNVAKHARATEVEMRFELEQKRLRLVIRDDGTGFDLVEKAPSNRTVPAASATGNGLENMRHRMESMGGTAAFRTSPGQGTEIVLEVEV